MGFNKYKVNFTIDKEVIAEDEEEAEERALDEILEGNGYYVHDYIDHESTILIGEATQDEIDELELD